MLSKEHLHEKHGSIVGTYIKTKKTDVRNARPIRASSTEGNKHTRPSIRSILQITVYSILYFKIVFTIVRFWLMVLKQIFK